MNQLLYGISLVIYMMQLAESVDGIIEVSCDVSSNICLYRDENKINWDAAYDKCVEMNANLLTIPSSSVQAEVDKFLNHTLDSDTTTTIWIAGKQSDNTTPIDLTGKLYSSDIFLGESQDDCVYGEAIGKLTWDNCDEIRGNHKVICQYQGICAKSDVSFSGNCYKLHGDSEKYSWFTARSICRERNGSDIIYTGADNKAFLQNLSDYFDVNSFWTGIYRRPWQWIEGSPKEAHTAHYFNFMSLQGDEEGQSCLQMNKLDGFYSWVWSTAMCTEVLTRHFICQNETDADTTAGIPETSDVTTLGNTLVSSDQMTDGEEDSGFNALYLIPVILAVVAAVILAVVLVLRKRRKPKPPKPTLPIYENDEEAQANYDRANPTNQPYTDSSTDHYSEINLDIVENDDGYASVPGDGPLPEGSISPYGEYNTEQKPKLKNRVSALFMGLKPKLPTRKGFAKPSNSEIKASKDAKSGRKETMDSIRPPTSPKPKPKPKPKIPKANKAPNKPVRHFVTEQGDTYALSDKAIIDEPTVVIEGTNEPTVIIDGTNDDKTTAIQYKVTPQGDEYALVIKDDVNTSNDDITTGNDYAIDHMTTESGDVYALPTKDKMKPSAGLRDL